MANHPLVTTLKNLRGNPLACVLAEPLWGIPYNLYIPYMSVYMIALGVTDSQIGLIASIGMGLQIFSALLGGAITDKMGRRRTTLVFDLISWTVPLIIWTVAQNFTYFLIATIINSLWRITATSWTCLMVEDAEPETIVHMWSWIYIAGLLSSFFAPLAGLFVAWFSLVPTMRGLLFFACVMMTIKFFALNHFSVETSRGIKRAEETRSQPLLSMLAEYSGVLKLMLKSRKSLYALGIMVIMGIGQMINGTFWAVLVTGRLHIPAQFIAIYPFAKSLIMLFFFFAIMPRINTLHFEKPMLLGFCTFIISQLILITIPQQSYVLLLVSTILDAFSVALVSPLLDSLVTLTIDPADRARIMSIMTVVVLVFTSPFGWIAGKLSEMNRTFPFILNIGLFAIGAALVIAAAQAKARQSSKTPSAA